MKAYAVAALVLATPFAAQAADPAINKVETGLLPAVVAKGAPAQAMSLSDEMRALHVPGVSILVIHKGKVAWVKGYGVTSDGGEAVTADTLFQAGSVSKPVAAMAALKLVQDGRLALDTPIDDTLKSWKLPDNAFTAQNPVTLRRLLSHTAGTTVHGFQGYAAGEAVPSVVQVLNGEKPANSAPVVVDQPVGQSYRYSGGGYTIMQQAVVDATGTAFPDVVEANVLVPLGMTRSTYRQPLPAGTARVALPHDEGGRPVTGGPHTYPEMAAAGLWTTAPDLARYALELMTAPKGQGKVLNADLAKTMLTPGLGSWGLGLQVAGGPANPYFYHDGANEGYKATLVGYPASGDGAVILTNGDQGYQLGQEIVRAIATTYNWPDFRPITRDYVAVPIEAQKRFIGIFEIKDLGTFEILKAGDQMVAEIRAGQRLALLTGSDHSFFTTAQNIVLTFASADDPDNGVVDADGFHAEFHRVAAK
ncbi:serine hydrolase domain-containing protein [Asticcacaulis taihuensis]|uniref:serine hydrolase domain-containing protein n=1 Tax=Asticcacaulis taihuensis TaxID=260084 RepID=UPI0026F27B4C|nr:serine hydrolase domain-containing protein [Asticcacaulis taihuensis]